MAAPGDGAVEVQKDGGGRERVRERRDVLAIAVHEAALAAAPRVAHEALARVPAERLAGAPAAARTPPAWAWRP